MMIWTLYWAYNMDILFNELSLTGQFASREQFVTDALPPLVALLNEIDFSKNVLFKKQNFYTFLVTGTDSIHDILIGSISRQYKEVVKFKSQLRQLFDNPYWEDDRKHSSTCTYEYDGTDVCNHSMAEACERDRVMLSFTHPDFSKVKLSVLKNKTIEIELDNLFAIGHYNTTARQRGIIVDFSLRDTTRFSKTRHVCQGQPVYREKKTNYYWYLDNLHKDHYEVFDSNEIHIGIADMQGNIDPSGRVDNRRF
jgi:hypothetical protein